MSTPTTAPAISQPNAGLSELWRQRCSCACVRCDAQEQLFCSASPECGGCCCHRGSAREALHSQRWVILGGLDPFCKCKVTARLQEDVCDTAGVSDSRWVQAVGLHLDMSRQNPPPCPARSWEHRAGCPFLEAVRAKGRRELIQLRTGLTIGGTSGGFKSSN